MIERETRDKAALSVRRMIEGSSMKQESGVLLLLAVRARMKECGRQQSFMGTLYACGCWRSSSTSFVFCCLLEVLL